MSRPAPAILLLLLPLAVSLGPAQAVSLPMYGNWCGPDHPRDAYAAQLPPVDSLDAACMEHDICAATSGSGDCGCDIRFMNRLRGMTYAHPEQRTIARAMYDALAMIPCADPMGTAYKQACLWSDLASDFFSGRGGPWDMPLRWMYLSDRTLRNRSWQDRWGW